MNLSLEDLQALFEIAQRSASTIEKRWLRELADQINAAIADQAQNANDKEPSHEPPAAQ